MLRHRELLTRAQWWGLGLLSLLLAVAVFDYVAYNFKFFQLQGRYLFPALVAIAFALVVGLRELLAREYERLVFAALYIALVAFDLASLFLFIVPQLKP
jgi:FtsH-binding integral membrane protein